MAKLVFIDSQTVLLCPYLAAVLQFALAWAADINARWQNRWLAVKLWNRVEGKPG